MKSIDLRLITLLTCIIMCATLLRDPCRLAAQGTTGTIQGTVTDASGAAVPGATVRAKNAGTGAELTATTDGQGRYLIPDLPVAEYSVEASKQGFANVQRIGVALIIGSNSVVDFSMPVGEQQQTVTVQAEASQVQTTNATIENITSQTQMAELPLNGRNFEELIQLAPGVSSFAGYGLHVLYGSSPSGIYSIGGARPVGQAILLDGENMQTFWNTGMGSILGTSLGVEAIGEFQTLTNNFTAQFDGMGVINSVSKSGTNVFHGSAYDYLRNSALDARSFFNGLNVPPFRRNQFGGSVGGPVKKDKAFFFVNYEGVRQLLSESYEATVPACNVPGVCTPTATNPAVAQEIANTLSLFPTPSALIGGGLGTVITQSNQLGSENYVLARFDYILSDKDSIFARYVSDQAHLSEPYPNGVLPISGPEIDNSHSTFSVLEERHIFSPTLVNTLHVGYSRLVRTSADPYPATAPNGSHPLQFLYAGALQQYLGTGHEDGIVNIPGISGIGADLVSPFNFTQNRYTVADDLLWNIGKHTIRFGGRIQYDQSNTFNPIFSDSDWTFNSFSQFLAGQAFIVIGSGGTYFNRDYRQTEYLPYVQDEWKVSPKLTVTLGLRWEFVTDPYSLHNDLYAITNFATSTGFTNVSHIFANNPAYKNIDPRVGLAYDPFSDHKTSIRMGFGLFHELFSPSLYQPPFGLSPPSVLDVQLFAQYPYPFSSVTPSLVGENPGWDYHEHAYPYLIQYNVSIQRQLAESTLLTVSYVGSHGVHQMTDMDENPIIPQVVNGVDYFSNAAGIPYPRMNPLLAEMQVAEPVVTLRYNSMQVNLNRRFSHNFQGQVSYTWGRCINDGGFALGGLLANANSTVTNPYNRELDKGRCWYDVNQQLRANGVYALPFQGNRLIEGWQVSSIITADSGPPFTFNDGYAVSGQSGSLDGPNYVSGCNVYANQTLAHWFNTACFTPAVTGTVGTVGKTNGNGPGLFDLDFALLKNTRIRERLAMQFRAEFFNILNHPSFGLPSAAIFSPSGQVLPSAGLITSTVGTARQIQFALKFTF